jgi:hypothetical protein
MKYLQDEGLYLKQKHCYNTDESFVFYYIYSIIYFNTFILILLILSINQPINYSIRGISDLVQNLPITILVLFNPVIIMS